MIRYYKHGDLDITTIRPNIKSDKQLILPIPQSAKAGNNLLIEKPLKSPKMKKSVNCAIPCSGNSVLPGTK